MTNRYSYSSLGNRIADQNYQAPRILPWYLDGDYSPIPSFSQYKDGSGTAQDMTQMVGPLDIPKQSGAAGEGASGNPDVAPGGNASMFTDLNYAKQLPGYQQPGILPAFLDETGHVTTRPPSEAHLPGFGTDKAPASAPAAVQDQATHADKRLAGMYGAQRFWGAKPGQQLGSRSVDDLRDMRQPLPAYTPVGGVSGPPGFPTGRPPRGIWGYVGILPAYPPAGPWPMLDNPGDGSGGASSGGGEGNGGGSDPGSSGGGGGGSTGIRHVGIDIPTRAEMEAEVASKRAASQSAAAGESALQEAYAKEVAEASGAPDDYFVAPGRPEAKAEAMQHAMDAQDPYNWDTVWEMLNDPLWGTVILLPLALLTGPLTIGGRAIELGFESLPLVDKVESITRGIIARTVELAADRGGFVRLGRAAASAASAVAEEEGDTYVYYGIKQAKRVYVGITNNLKARGWGHGPRFDYLARINETPVARKLARAIEQVLFERNPHFENINNPIDPRRPIYREAVEKATRWLIDNEK